jgi:Peptidase C39 family
MSIELPLYAQSKPNTCALACLRMVLAAYGRDVEESTLEGQARLEPDGTDIGELERLGRQFGLITDIREMTVEQLRQLFAEGKLAITYIDRAVFVLTPAQRVKHSLRAARLHVVVPARITTASVRATPSFSAVTTGKLTWIRGRGLAYNPPSASPSTDEQAWRDEQQKRAAKP